MKSMKKSMFVTTILMVVLLIVALSTATFAWYTAQSSVTANTYTVTSANSGASSLVVDGAPAITMNESNSAVTLVMNDNIAPMVYTGSAPTVDTTAYGTSTTGFLGSLYTFTRTSAGNFVAQPVRGTAATLTSVTGDESHTVGTSIYVTNVGSSPIATLHANVTINNGKTYVNAGLATGATIEGTKYEYTAGNYVATEDTTAQEGKTYYNEVSNDNLCVAIFAGTADTADASLVLKGIYRSTGKSSIQVAPASLADATAGSSIATAFSTATTYSTGVVQSGASTIDIASSVGTLDSIKVKVIAWFEGDLMTNVLAGTTGAFTISFTV